MAVKELKTIIQLRRAGEAVYTSDPSFVPRKGELLFVDMEDGGVRYKVGDGSSTYSSLSYADVYVVKGYYYNGEFYANTSHTEKYLPYENKVYIDITESSTGKVYCYNGSSYVLCGSVPKHATETVEGIMKLYKTSGSNEDGTMTQKCITEGVNSIKFALDDEQEECLVLDLPWD